MIAWLIAIGVISTTVWKAMLGLALATSSCRPVIAGDLAIMGGTVGGRFVLAR